MRLIRFSKRSNENPLLTREPVLLRQPVIDDFAEWARLRQESAGFLKPWEPSWLRDEFTRKSFKARLQQQDADIRSGRGLHWFIFLREANTLVGGIALTNIRKGIAQTGTFGYWMGEEFAGKGYMKQAVLAVCDHAFGEMKLHRLEAATVVRNERSQGLLKACGFSEEGLARRYLKINGEWEDHILFAKLSDDHL